MLSDTAILLAFVLYPEKKWGLVIAFASVTVGMFGCLFYIYIMVFDLDCLGKNVGSLGAGLFCN